MKTKTTSHHGHGVEQFLAKHGADVTGVIAGFDRLRLRASLRWLYQLTFMKRYLCEARVLLKDFGAYASGLSNRIRGAAHAFAARTPAGALPALDGAEQGRARPHARRAGWRPGGLIGVFDIVEPCLTYFVRGERAAHGSTWSCARASGCITTSISSMCSSVSCTCACSPGFRFKSPSASTAGSGWRGAAATGTAPSIHGASVMQRFCKRLPAANGP